MIFKIKLMNFSHILKIYRSFEFVCIMVACLYSCVALPAGIFMTIFSFEWGAQRVIGMSLFASVIVLFGLGVICKYMLKIDKIVLGMCLLISPMQVVDPDEIILG